MVEATLHRDASIIGWDRYGRKIYVDDIIELLPIENDTMPEPGDKFLKGRVTGHKYKNGYHCVETDNPKIGDARTDYIAVNLGASPHHAYRCVYDKNGNCITLGDYIWHEGHKWVVIDIIEDYVSYLPSEPMTGWPYDGKYPIVPASEVMKA